jgi:FixJ family two-component response regulator
MESKNNKPRIAIVDDDVSVCRAMKRLVRSIGMDADTFVSGQEFIDRLDGMPSFDCVILDVHMPGLNGLEVQESLTGSRQDIPVIFMTAVDEASVRERALASGAVAFLNKPITDELIAETLRAALKLPVDRRATR